MSTSSNSSGGIGICGMLGIVFIILKLTNVIDWSWIWVTSPFWIGPAILIFLLLVAGIIVGTVFLIGCISDQKENKRDQKIMDAIRKVTGK